MDLKEVTVVAGVCGFISMLYSSEVGCVFERTV